MTQKPRYIGLDFGDKTIGVALGCPDSRVATGLETIRRNLPEALRPSINRLREIIAAYNITHIVLGHPLNMDGSLSPRAVMTGNFRDKLQRNFKSLEIVLWDERLSTQAVTRAFATNTTHGSKKRKETYNLHVDEMAAVYILQGYLSSL
ncbi:MAG: Holliday junction resolvase RuvX [Defluviitaleaceae bacterium]|nr:Holliday junction resolvase RuvX [Defluviitaleaceae bacterium]